ncbi:hypothetical protein [Streptomyces hypolithicus]
MHASVRVLAVAAPKVWIAVRGRFRSAQVPALAGAVADRIPPLHHVVYLDVAEASCEHDVPAPDFLRLLPAPLRLHLVGAGRCPSAGDIAALRGTVHDSRGDAWTAWLQEEQTGPAHPSPSPTPTTSHS